MNAVAAKQKHVGRNYKAQEVVERVEARLAPYQPAEAALEVLPNYVHQEGQWWYVVVPASQGIMSAADYNCRVEKAERDLYKMDALRVGILPVVPDWMDTHK